MTHIVAIVLILGLCLPQTLLAGVILQDGEIDQIKEKTDTLSVKKENKSRRIVGKLAGGVLGGVLLGLVGGVAGGAISDCSSTEDTYCKLEYGWPGLWLGYLVGVPVGINRMDTHDRFTYSLAGSLIGGTASFAVFKMVESQTVEKIWPALVICPLVGSTIMSEVFRKPLEVRRVSIGLFPGPKGRVSAVATLRF